MTDRADGPYLLVSGRAHQLGPVTVVGRDPDCHVRLEDRDVSRRHAELRNDNGAVTVRDLHSTNGVWVNDLRIAGPTRLISGDVLRLGAHVLAFVTGVSMDETVETVAVEHATGAPSSDPAGLGEPELIEALDRASRGAPAPGAAPLARVLLGELGAAGVTRPISEALMGAVARFVISRGRATRDPRWTALLFDALARQPRPLPDEALVWLEAMPSTALERTSLARYLSAARTIPSANEEPLAAQLSRLAALLETSA